MNIDFGVEIMNDRAENDQHRQQGSILIVVALAMTALLGAAAIVADVGLLYVTKARLQNGLDAAALAGAQLLPAQTAEAVSNAVNYAGANGISEDKLTVQLAMDNHEIIVTGERQVNTLFARIWGINSNTVRATAKAMMVPPAALAGIVPISIQLSAFQNGIQYGHEYTLKEGGGDQFGNGWFGALDLPHLDEHEPEGANWYENNLANGYAGTVKIGDVIPVRTGNISGKTEDGVNSRYDKDTNPPSNTPTSYAQDAPEIVYVPVVVPVDNHNIRIVGFAAFFLERITGNGNNSEIKGQFLRTVIVDGQAEGSQTDIRQTEEEIAVGGSPNDFGLYAPKLILD